MLSVFIVHCSLFVVRWGEQRTYFLQKAACGSVAAAKLPRPKCLGLQQKSSSPILSSGFRRPKRQNFNQSTRLSVIFSPAPLCISLFPARLYKHSTVLVMPPPWEPDVWVVKHYSATRLRCPYSNLSELNTLDVYLPFPQPPPSSTTKYWIM